MKSEGKNRYKNKEDWGGNPEDINKKQKGKTRENTQNQGLSGDEVTDAADQLDGLKDAQKRNPEAIKNTQKSEQNLKKAMKEKASEHE